MMKTLLVTCALLVSLWSLPAHAAILLDESWEGTCADVVSRWGLGNYYQSANPQNGGFPCGYGLFPGTDWQPFFLDSTVKLFGSQSLRYNYKGIQYSGWQYANGSADRLFSSSSSEIWITFFNRMSAGFQTAGGAIGGAATKGPYQYMISSKCNIGNTPTVGGVPCGTAGAVPQQNGWVFHYMWGTRQIIMTAQGIKDAVPAYQTQNLKHNIQEFNQPDLQWVCYEAHIRLNTPGQANGLYEQYATNVSAGGPTILTTRYLNREFLGATIDDKMPSDARWYLARTYRQDGLGSMWYDKITYSTTRVGCTGGSTQPIEPPPDTTPPSIPVLTTNVSGTTITATWTASSDVSGIGSYTLRGCTGLGCIPTATIATINGNVLTYARSGLANNTIYGHCLAATDSAPLQNTTPCSTPIQYETTAALTAGNNTYIASADFSGTQGFRQWYYLDSLGNNLTYNSAGSSWGGSGFLTIWNVGGHPSTTLDAVRRWDAPDNGTIQITGSVSDAHGGCGDGVTATIKKDSTTLFTQSLSDGDTTGVTYSLSTAVTTGQHIDFIINRGPTTNNGCDSTNFNPQIIFIPTANPEPTVPPTLATFSGTPTSLTVTAGAVTPTYVRILHAHNTFGNISSIEYPWSAFVAGVLTTVIPDGTQYSCAYPRDASHVEIADSQICIGTIAGVPSVRTTAIVMGTPFPVATLPAGTTSALYGVPIDVFGRCRADTVNRSYLDMDITTTAVQLDVNNLNASATLSGLTNGSSTTRYIQCEHLNGFDQEYYTETAAVVTIAVANSTVDVTAPGPATGVVCTPVSNTSNLDCSWVAPADLDIDFYRLFLASGDCSTYTFSGQTVEVTSAILTLTEKQTYCLKVEVVDTSLNPSALSTASTSVTTSFIPDTEPPSVMKGLQITANSFTKSGVFTWTPCTDVQGPCRAQLEYCSTLGCSNFVPLGPRVDSGQLVQNLTPGTFYRVRGICYDTSGNPSGGHASPIYSDVIEFMTASSGLTIPRESRRTHQGSASDVRKSGTREGR